MFYTIEEKQNDLKRLKLLNEHTGEYVSIIPRFGSNINELILKKRETLYDIIDGNPDRASFTGKGIFKGANLIPFPNRLKDGKYTFGGIDYQLFKNYPEEGNAAHGFIYDKPFEVIQKKSETHFAQVTLRYLYDGSLVGYPFPFELHLIYTLSDSEGFQCESRFSNKHDQSIPFGSGWHPFFTFKKKVNQLSLKFSPEKEAMLDSSLIPDGTFQDFNLFDSLKPIDKDSYDSCFYLKNGSDGHYTELYDPKAEVTIQLWQETGPGKYNYLQIYTPPHRNSIAIEPMTCTVNSFNSHDGLIILNKGQSFSAKYGVKLI